MAPTPSTATTFAPRLARAIDALTPAQQEVLLRQAPQARGLKAALAEIAGLPGPSVLSDILAGRSPGMKYRAPLANALAVDLAWLEGEPVEPPDWDLAPVTAWLRFARRLAEAGRRARPLTPGPDESNRPHRGEASRHADAVLLARALDCDIRDEHIIDLLAERFNHVPLDLLWTYSAHVGLAKPHHHERLCRGREAWAACEGEVANQIAQSVENLRRLFPPVRLLQAMRGALVERLQGGLEQTEAVLAMQDGIELLWRQQWRLQGRPRRELPASFTADTGRVTWTRIAIIRERWRDNGARSPSTRAKIG